MSQPKIAASRLPNPSEFLVGRDRERALLDDAWSGTNKKNVVTFVAWGGTGKTALVARWAADKLAEPHHGGVERYFDWSFYSQGSGDDKTASADIFIKTALEFFGDRALAESSAGGWQKGERLAQLAGEHRSLLILDGLEPLQAAQDGALRDDSLRALFRGLATQNRGLCVITTRQTVPELNLRRETTTPEYPLRRLSTEAGADLLSKLGVKGTPAEREQLAADVKGHALTLTLLGKYLAEAHAGDIRKRDLVSLSEADYEETNGHAFRVMEAYERWLQQGGRHAELAILRLLGLFDRPATADCLDALRQPPVIGGLTDTLLPLNDAQWRLAVQRLVKLGLVEEQPWEPRLVFGYSKEEAATADFLDLGDPQLFQSAVHPAVPISLDAHPLVREYFAARLRDANDAASCEAHSRLYEHLCRSVPYWPDGLDGLEPLYQAIPHGCHAVDLQDVCDEVYRDRVCRGAEGTQAFYSSRKLGAMGANLGAVRNFFVTPWTVVSTDLPEDAQPWLLNEAALYLRVLGRLTEARGPLRAAVERRILQEDWRNAATTASNLANLEVSLGDITSAVREGEQGVELADRSEDAFRRTVARAMLADALHQQGSSEAAAVHFAEAERFHREQLYSFRGFLFCDFLLAIAEYNSWRKMLQGSFGCVDLSSITEVLDGVRIRVTAVRDVSLRRRALLDIALDHLTLGRVAFYGEILGIAPNQQLNDHLEHAVDGFRAAGAIDDLPRALLTRAWFHKHQNRDAEARADLAEAEAIAERGPMPLYLADIHLHRARLFFREDREVAKEQLAKARELIFKHGYFRRKEELEDAERVILA